MEFIYMTQPCVFKHSWLLEVERHQSNILFIGVISPGYIVRSCEKCRVPLEIDLSIHHLLVTLR